MNFALAIGYVIAVVVVALVLGWSEKNVKRPAAKVFIWIGTILFLLAIRWWDGQPLEIAGLPFVTLLQGLKHIPAWVEWIMIALTVAWFIYLILTLIGNSFIEVLQEIEQTNVRLRLFERSLISKLDDISRRLPEDDEPSENC
jgi:hypothetical protein